VAIVRENGRLRVARERVDSRERGEQRLAELRARPDVVAADFDAPVHQVDVPGPDPRRSEQWALDRVQFEPTWTETPGSDATGITVGIIDSGVRATHEELNDGRVLAGCDFVDPNGGDGTNDENGHGTFVSGIVAAETQNSLGISAAAPGAKILPARVLGADGKGLFSDVDAAVIWAADNGADVINLSLGASSAPSTTQEAIQYAVGQGVVVVASAGNCGHPGPGCQGSVTSYPAAFNETIAVAAMAQDDTIASFSSYGSYVDLAGPGVAIVSAYGTGNSAYNELSGTSFSSPYAAAAAAILRAVCPAASPAQIQSRLQVTAEDLGTAGRDDFFGWGLIRPDEAVKTC
jgi:serine protease